MLVVRRSPSLAHLALLAPALAFALSACASGGTEPDGGVTPGLDGGPTIDAGPGVDATAQDPDGGSPGDDAGSPPTCADLTCDPNATCDASSGAAMCVCDAGYEGDGTTCTPVDECPSDPDKTAPGVCGCGTPDTDTDSDGAADCVDECPDDMAKTMAGACGCGVADTDGDADGTPDCVDDCPSDGSKTTPGLCGCGMAETDSDADGTPDCVDDCPSDGSKTSPGTCGCGTPETDSDADGTPDCVDACPSDGSKTAPGICGCGTAETDSDSDGTPDCVDLCPSDPLKTAPGSCGCGVPDSGGSTHTIADPPIIDWTTTRYFRANVYQATSNTTLQSFEHYLGLSSTCTVAFFVYSSSSSTGPWTVEWSTTRSLPAGISYRDSGAIGVSISSGTYYGLGVGWDCSGGNYFGDNSFSAGYDAGIGTFQRTIWDNAYPGYSSSYTPPNYGSGGTAYTQRISLGGCSAP